MVRGTLEVLLVGGKGLENTDFLCNMDPYVIITCRTQEQKSSVVSGKGCDPEWNENFVFALSDDVPELLIKILDSDGPSEDDFVGEAKVPLEPLFVEGSMPPMSYNVVKDEKYCGEIRLGLKFTPERCRDEGFAEQGGTCGGFKESSCRDERLAEQEGICGGCKESSCCDEGLAEQGETYGGWKESSC